MSAGCGRWERVGLAAAVVAFASLGLLVALGTAPFRSADESQHVSYALAVSHGRLPTLATVARPEIPGMRGLPAGCVVSGRVNPRDPTGPGSPVRPGRSRRTRRSGVSPPPSELAGGPVIIAAVARPVARAGASGTVAARSAASGAGSRQAGLGKPGSRAAASGTSGTSGLRRSGSAGSGRSARGVGRAPAAPAGCPGRIDASMLVYTANHPPLFYVLQAGPLRAGVAAGHAVAGLRAARIVNLGLGALGLLATAWLVRLLLPGRPDLAVATAALTGLSGVYLDVSGQVYNDALGMATITFALAAAVAVIVRGPSPARLILVCAAALAAAATRAAGLETAALIAPAVGIGVGLRTAGAARRRRPADLSSGGRVAVGLVAGVGAGLGAALAVAGTVAAGIGWFYLRNISLYGDATGARVAALLFPERPTPVETALSSRHFWWTIYRGWWGRDTLIHGSLRDMAIAFLVAVPAGLVLLVLRWSARRWSGRRLGPRPVVGPWSPAGTPVTSAHVLTAASGGRTGTPLTPGQAGVGAVVTGRAGGEGAGGQGAAAQVGTGFAGRLVAGGLVAANLAVAVGSLLVYVSEGGAWFTRYLLPGLPEAMLLLALALAALPVSRRGLPTTAALVTFGWAASVIMGRESVRDGLAPARASFVGRLSAALENDQLSHPRVVVGLLLGALVAGLAGLAVAGWQLSRAAVPRWLAR